MKTLNDLKEGVLLVIAFLLIVLPSFFAGEYYGRTHSTNPQLVKYEQQKIVVTPGDAICPPGHMCTWKPWDLTTGAEVKP
jgi:hypothetical protein